MSISCEALVSLDVFIPHVPLRSYRDGDGRVRTEATAAMLLPVMSSMPRTIQWVRDTGYYLTQTDEGKDGISINMRCYDRVLYQKNFASYRLLHQAPPTDGRYGNNWNNPGIFSILAFRVLIRSLTTIIFNCVDHCTLQIS